MYNQPFFIPGYYGSVMPGMIRSSLGRAMAPGAVRGGIFSRLASTFGAIKNFNWSGLINNTSKTLGIINQGIPLVRQVGPMMNNMRSMMKIASIFKDETDTNTKVINKKNNTNNYSNTSEYNKNSQYNTQHLSYDNSPTFFIN